MDAIAGFGSVVLVILVFIGGFLFYFIPAIVAYKKQRDNKVSILLLNLFLGWTLIGWVASLVWAFKEK